MTIAVDLGRKATTQTNIINVFFFIFSIGLNFNNDFGPPGQQGVAKVTDQLICVPRAVHSSSKFMPTNPVPPSPSGLSTRLSVSLLQTGVFLCYKHCGSTKCSPTQYAPFSSILCTLHTQYAPLKHFVYSAYTICYQRSILCRVGTYVISVVVRGYTICSS